MYIYQTFDLGDLVIRTSDSPCHLFVDSHGEVVCVTVCLHKSASPCAEWGSCEGWCWL